MPSVEVSGDTGGVRVQAGGVSSTAGQLLVSIPDMGDDNFDQTVVLMLEHDGNGALGVVLNRPSGTEVAEHMAHLGTMVATPPWFFVGGPVAVGGLLALGRQRLGAPLTRGTRIIGPVVLIEPRSLIDGDVDELDVIRLFTGYSGWAPGQLEGELAAGTWHVVPSLPDDVFTSEPENLWRSVMRRQGGRLLAQSLFPEDVSAN